MTLPTAALKGVLDTPEKIFCFVWTKTPPNWHVGLQSNFSSGLCVELKSPEALSGKPC